MDNPFEVTSAGFRWEHSQLVTYQNRYQYFLWTDCTTLAETNNDGPPILGASVEQNIAIAGTTADRWVLSITAGSTVSVAVDAVGDGFPGAELSIVRPDGCLARQSDEAFACTGDTTAECPGTAFTANATGDWGFVVGGDAGGSADYRLGVQVDGVDAEPTLVDDDALVREAHAGTYTGYAVIEGEWTGDTGD